MKKKRRHKYMTYMSFIFLVTFYGKSRAVSRTSQLAANIMNNNQQLERVVADPKTMQCALGFKGEEGVIK